jgi:hypothetical protein
MRIVKEFRREAQRDSAIVESDPVAGRGVKVFRSEFLRDPAEKTGLAAWMKFYMLKEIIKDQLLKVTGCRCRFRFWRYWGSKTPFSRFFAHVAKNVRSCRCSESAWAGRLLLRQLQAGLFDLLYIYIYIYIFWYSIPPLCLRHPTMYT